MRFFRYTGLLTKITRIFLSGVLEPECMPLSRNHPLNDPVGSFFQDQRIHAIDQCYQPILTRQLQQFFLND